MRAKAGSRQVLALLVLASLPTAGRENATAVGAREPGTPPNVVLIFADDLGYGNLGSYGQQLIETPRLDRMAAEGLRLTDFYSGDAWCPVSRNSMLTGLHSGHTQLRGVGVLEEDSPEEPRYLQRHLQQAGYRTGMFGKWGLGSYEPVAAVGAEARGGRPSHVGFDEFLGHMTHRDAHNFTLPPYPQQPGDPWLHPKLWTVSDGETVEVPELDVPYIQDPLLAGALDFIERHRDEPFFLYLPTALPHAELFLPEDDKAWTPYLDEDGRSIFPETPWPGNHAFRRPVEFPRATFAAMVTRLDREVGLVLDQLEALGLAQDTLVLFLSDNGPAVDGGFESPDFFDSSGGLRDYKLSLYEGGIRVPMIAYWPGTIAAGRETDLPMAVWDLFPTLLELAGIEPPPGLDGVSMVPLLSGNDGEQPTHDLDRPLYWETFNGLYRSQAVRFGDWKAVRPAITGGGDPVELYHLATDPRETLDESTRRRNCALLLQLKEVMNAAHVPPPEDPFGILDVPPLDLECPVLPPCAPDPLTLCLQDGRFQARFTWHASPPFGGTGRVVPGFSNNSGIFYFFDPENWEVLLKVLDGCAINGHFWVFASAATDLGWDLAVLDTASGETWTASKPAGVRSPAVTDTRAFATCP